MPSTNDPTAQAATRTAPNLNRTLTLLGIFTSKVDIRALIRTDSGTTFTLHIGVHENGLTLMETGDGWAIVQENNRVHRLVIA